MDFEKLVKQYHAYVVTIVYNILHGYLNEIDIQAVVNQVFFQVWNNRNKINQDKYEDIKPYIGAIARNTAISERNKIRPHLELDEHIIGEVNGKLSQVELQTILSKAIKQLEKENQIILLKFYFQGKTINQIAEEAVDLLAENQSDDSYLDNYSIDKTLSAMQETLSPKTIVKRKVPVKFRFLLAAAFVLMISAVAIASSNAGAQLLSEVNKHLVGLQGKGTASIYNQDGELISGTGRLEIEEDIWKTSTVIKKKPKGDFVFHTVTEFSVDEKNGKYISPEFMFNNADLVILTKENGEGWYLEKGQSLKFVSQEYESEVNDGNGQTVHYGYVYKGALLGDEEKYYCKGIEQEYQITAEKAGEYYICLLNYTSDPISFRKGEITVMLHCQ